MDLRNEWRGYFGNDDLNQLHAAAFTHRVLDDDWWTQVTAHSLGWVCAYSNDSLVGFVKVAWDGGVHAFVLDTMVDQSVRRLGIGTRLVAEAVIGARQAGCEWLHVDFEGHLRDYYFEACGFTPADAASSGRSDPSIAPHHQAAWLTLPTPARHRCRPANRCDEPLPAGFARTYQAPGRIQPVSARRDQPR